MTFEPDDSQRAVIDIDSATRQIVFAGPGAGKTQVVSALIEHLIDDCDVDPASGVLVLSFSNAAVFAVDARLASRGIDPVPVRTLDSIASDILRDLDEYDAYEGGYDARVARATRLLREHGWDTVDDIEHLVVDEIQDVVGVRAELLRALVEALPEESGVTFLGDPAQGIYDFQIRAGRDGRPPLSTTTSRQLIDFMLGDVHAEVKELTGQYRALTRDTRAAAGLRASLASGGNPLALDGFESGLPVVGSIQDACDLAKTWAGVTAFLTQTNGQASLVAEEIAAAGGSVVMRRSVQEVVLAGWIARLLANHPTLDISREEFEQAIESQKGPTIDPVDGWRSLRSIAGGRSANVKLRELATGLARRRPLPPALLAQPVSKFVVSTVHRAKGLEFDDVVLVDFEERRGEGETDDVREERLRTRFVALTRAQSRLVRVRGPEARWLRRVETSRLSRARWVLGGPKQWMTHGFEMTAADTAVGSLGRHDAQLAQSVIRDHITPGAAVRFELDADESSLTRPVYSVLHGETVVAQTSEAFGRDLAYRVGDLTGGRRRWPVLEPHRIEDVVTQIDAPSDAAPHGLYLAPVIAGFVRLKWKESANE